MKPRFKFVRYMYVWDPDEIQPYRYRVYSDGNAEYCACQRRFRRVLGGKAKPVLVPDVQGIGI